MVLSLLVIVVVVLIAEVVVRTEVEAEISQDFFKHRTEVGAELSELFFLLLFLSIH